MIDSNRDAVTDLADDIATATTLGDLDTLRRRLQHSLGILDVERAVLAESLIERERAVIRFLCPNV